MDDKTLKMCQELDAGGIHGKADYFARTAELGYGSFHYALACEYEKLKSGEKVAQLFNTTNFTVFRRLRLIGITARNRGGYHGPGSRYLEKIKKIKNTHKKTADEIASKVGCNTQTVWNLCRLHGIKLKRRRDYTVAIMMAIDSTRTCSEVAVELDITHQTVWRTVRANGFPHARFRDLYEFVNIGGQRAWLRKDRDKSTDSAYFRGLVV